MNEALLPPILKEYLDRTKAYTDAKTGMLVTAWLPFAAAVETLIEREAVKVEAYQNVKRTGKMYVISSDIYRSWHPGEGD